MLFLIRIPRNLLTFRINSSLMRYTKFDGDSK